MIRRVKSLIWTIIRVSLRRMGIDAFLSRPGYNYLNVPDYYGRSAHKHLDIRSLPGFGPLAAMTIQQGRSYLYYDRLYVIYQSLVNLQRLAKSPDNINLAEVGVFRGGTSHFIASSADALGLKTASLHCFDTFEGTPAEDIRPEIDAFRRPEGFSDTQFVTVKEYLKEFSNIMWYKGRFQDTCSQIESQNFHFIHLDVDIYEPTFFALQFFDKRLVSGGIIIVDDYGFTTCPGVKQAVDEFVSAKKNYFSMHSLTGQCVLVKREEG